MTPKEAKEITRIKTDINGKDSYEANEVNSFLEYGIKAGTYYWKTLRKLSDALEAEGYKIVKK